jgi:cobalt-zinc-cadmium efflux system membrane fusion protein
MNVPSHGSNTQRKLWIGAGVIVAIVVGFFAWQRLAPAPKASDKPAEKNAAEKPASDTIAVNDQQLAQISTDVVKNRLVSVDRKATGKIGFNEDRLTPVFAPFSGRVVELLANKGDSARSGQSLAIVESPDFVGAQNDLASARSDLVKANIGLNAAQVAGQRAQRLHDQEALSTKDLQQAEADLARAQDDVRRSQAAVAAAENRLRLFGKEPDETAGVDPRVVLRAPIPGTIVDRKVGPGQYVKPDNPDPLFLISDLSTLWVLVDVYESDVASIRLNMPVEVSVAAYPDRVFPAHISFISPTVDPTSRTVRVRCLVPNPGGLLKPDMFATIKIAAAEQQPMATVPSSAVVVEGNESLVFVSDSPGHFRRRPVRVGKEIEGGFIIDSGLRQGEVIATRGALLLNELSKSKE